MKIDIVNNIKKIKNINKSGFVFIFAVIFILSGYMGEKLGTVGRGTITFVKEIKQGNFEAFADYANEIKSVPDRKVAYHAAIMDLDSLKNNILGTKVVMKEDGLIAKTDDGFLVGLFQDKYSDKEINGKVDEIDSIWKKAEENGSKFLYCIRPDGACYAKLPPNVVSCHNKENIDNFEKEMKKRNIPYMNYMNILEQKNMSEEDIFFVTDHHWKPEVGFMATEILCDELADRYNEKFEEKYFDINNYNVEVKKKYFLGAFGKKVGSYFTWRGLDDFEIITPKFETDFTVEVLNSDTVREGTFDNTVFYKERLGEKVYGHNQYAAYSGGDYRLQIMRNNLNKGGKKVLLIRDSFSCVIAPFLSLQLSELHLLDNREGDYPEGEIVDILKYIENEKFDYVIMIK